MNLKGIATATIQAELARRQKSSKTLMRKRDKLRKELDKIEAMLEGIEILPSSRGRSSTAGTGRRRRAHNEISLGDALAQAMEVRAVVSPSEASKLVRSNGYKSTSEHFNMMVSNALSKDKRFKRIARGQYERVT